MVDLRGEETDGTNWQRRIAIALVAGLGIVLIYSLVYWWAINRVGPEESRSFVRSVQVVIESLTTAGFGGDTDVWLEHDELSALIILMNITGVLLVFLAIPLFAVPMFREALDRQPPTESSLRNHVIICGHSAIDDVLRRELEDADKPYLFVESDREEVIQLIGEGDQAIHGNAERINTLQRANAEHAAAVVADLDDETNPTVILSADRLNPELDIVSVVDTREAVPHHRYAGADEVVVSKESLGESLALRAMKTVSERFQEAVGIQNGPEFDEYLVPEGSDLVGQAIDEVAAFDEHGITVIGGWFGAKFVVSPAPETVILENSILLVSGEHGILDRLGARRLPSHQGHPSRVVVCGYGDVGRLAAETLEGEEISTTVVDRRNIEGVDIVGDVTRQGTLQQVGLDEARAVILALDDDVTTIYAALIIKHLAPDIEVIARANDPETVWKLYNAGADYVLSLPSVTGEVLAATLIDEDSILTPHDDFEFVRTEAPTLAGRTLAEADIRNETGATVVAIERGGELLTDIGPDTVVGESDVLIAAGSPGDVERFCELVGGN